MTCSSRKTPCRHVYVYNIPVAAPIAAHYRRRRRRDRLSLASTSPLACTRSRARARMIRTFIYMETGPNNYCPCPDIVA